MSRVGAAGMMMMIPRGWAVDFDALTFTRALQAYVQTGALGGGDSGDLVSSGVRAYEDLGDGAGSLLRIEGARTNEMLRSRDLTAASWNSSTFGAISRTAAYAAGIDGTVTATRVQVTAGAPGAWGYSQNHTGDMASPHTISGYRRATSGTTSHHYNYSATYVRDDGIGTTWQRFSKTQANTGSILYPIDTSGSPFPAIDILFDCMQSENGRFPSSPIVTTTVAVTRPADSLSGLSGDVPGGLFTTPGKYAQVSPEFANTDLVSGDELWLLSFGAGHGVRVRRNATDTRIEAVESGSVRAESQALTFSRNALLGEVLWNPSAGSLSVGGTPGPSGSAWSWSPAGVRVGGIHSGSSEAFCRLGALTGA